MLAAMLVNGENKVPSIYNRQHVGYRKKRGAKPREQERPVEAAKMKVNTRSYKQIYKKSCVVTDCVPQRRFAPVDVESEPEDVGQPSGVVSGKASGGRRKQVAERKVRNTPRKSFGPSEKY